MHNQKSQTILEQGFTFISGTEIITETAVEEDLIDLQDAFRHCISDGESRKRAYSRFQLLPTKKGEELNLCYGSSDYWQSKDLNSEAGGENRPFAQLPPEVLKNRAMVELLKLDYAIVPLDRIWKNFGKNVIEVGIHFIRMCASKDSPGVATPNWPHRDGEFFTFVHLLGRNGVTGGDSLIFSGIKSEKKLIRGPLLFTTTMENPLDTLVVWDRNVFHDVTPVEVTADSNSGVRDVILIDFTPCEPVRIDNKGRPKIKRSSFNFDAA